MSSTIKVNNIQNLAGDDSGFDLSTNDKIGMKIANSEVVTLDTTGVVFNENSADRDFRVESDANTHGLFLEGSTGNLGIGTTSPETIIHATGSSALLRLTADSNATAGVDFGDSGDTNIGRLLYDNSDNSMRFTTNASEAMRLHSNGRLSINATDDTTASQVNRLKIGCNNEALFGLGIEAVRNSGGGGIIITNNETSGTFDHILFKASNDSTVGKVSVSNTSTTYNTSSDYRLKENVVTDWDATTRLKQLKPSRFNFIADADTTVDGFLAHEVSDIVPEAITGEKDEIEKYKDDDGKEQKRPVYQGIDQSKLVPLLTKALQEAVSKIETLEAKVKALEGK